MPVYSAHRGTRIVLHTTAHERVGALAMIVVASPLVFLSTMILRVAPARHPSVLFALLPFLALGLGMIVLGLHILCFGSYLALDLSSHTYFGRRGWPLQREKLAGSLDELDHIGLRPVGVAGGDRHERRFYYVLEVVWRDTQRRPFELQNLFPVASFTLGRRITPARWERFFHELTSLAQRAGVEFYLPEKYLQKKPLLDPELDWEAGALFLSKSLATRPAP